MFLICISTISPYIKVTITRKNNLSSFNSIKYVLNKLDDKSRDSSDKITINKDEYKKLSNMDLSSIVILESAPKADIISNNIEKVRKLESTRNYFTLGDKTDEVVKTISKIKKSSVYKK